MAEVRLIQWWVTRDHPPSQLWVAMPVNRMWCAEAQTEWGPRFGPMGTKWFDTQSAAMDYAYDPHQAYSDGWMP